MAKDTGLHGYKDTGRHIISLLISFQAIYCLHTLALCLCVAYLRSGIRNRSRSRSSPIPDPAQTLARSINFPLKLFLNAAAKQDNSGGQDVCQAVPG